MIDSKMKLGDILLQKKIITNHQLRKALVIQYQEPKRKIGEIFLSLGYIDLQALTKILEEQIDIKDV